MSVQFTEASSPSKNAIQIVAGCGLPQSTRAISIINPVDEPASSAPTNSSSYELRRWAHRVRVVMRGEKNYVGTDAGNFGDDIFHGDAADRR